MPDGTPGPAESLALWRIAQTEGIGPMGFRRLLARHGSGAAALEALPRLLAKRQPGRGCTTRRSGSGVSLCHF